MKNSSALPRPPFFDLCVLSLYVVKMAEIPPMTFWVKESLPMYSTTQDKDSVQLNDQSLLYSPDGAGEIVDISMKGLSFLKLTGTSWPQGAFKVDLLLDNATLHIKEIPCALRTPANEATDSTLHSRHMLLFSDLNQDQQQQLQEYIARQKEGHSPFSSLS